MTDSGPPYSGPQVKPILDSIKSPDDMKGMDIRTLKQVSRWLFRSQLDQN